MYISVSTWMGDLRWLNSAKVSVHVTLFRSVFTQESRSPGTFRGLIDWYLAEQQKELEEGKEPLLSDEVIKANLLDILTAGKKYSFGDVRG